MDFWLKFLFLNLTEIVAGLLDAWDIYLPRVVAAAVVLLIGFGVAWLVRLLLAAVFRRLAENQLKAVPAGSVWISTLQILPRLVFWFLMVLVLGSVCHLLGLQLIVGWLEQLIAFLPRLLFGIVIVLAGWFGAGWLRNWLVGTLDRLQISYSETFGNLVRIITVVFAGVVGVGQLGVDLDFLTTTLEILLAGLLLAAALAFGLGARPSVENIMGLHYLRQNCQVGDVIQIGRWSGVVVEFHSTGVEIDTGKGRVLIPGRACSRQAVQFKEAADE